MNDITLTTTTHVQARWMLNALTDVASWARMKLKAAKSRSLVMTNSNVTERFVLRVQKEDIPSILNNPIKCLGKWFDASLQDTDNVRRLEKQVEDGLKKINSENQHALLPRIVWSMILYDVQVLQQKPWKELPVVTSGNG